MNSLAFLLNTNDSPVPGWSNKRILVLLALATLVVSVIWRLPEEGNFLARRMGELTVTLVLAMGLTYVLRPAVNGLMRWPLLARARGGRSWATLLVFIGCGLLVYLIFAFGLRSITRDLSTLWHSFIPSDMAEKRALFQKWSGVLSQAIAPYRDALPPEVQKKIEGGVASAASGAPVAIMGWVRNSFSHAGFIVELLLLPVLVFYFLADGRAIRQEAALLLPLGWRPAVARMVAHLDRVLDGYIRGQMTMCVIAWALVTLILWALHVPHAMTLGVVAGLTRAVPVIGPLLGGVPLALVCLLTTRSLPVTTTVIVAFIIMHFLESKVLLPRIIGHEVDLHPVSVIIVLLLGLEFFGFLGVFLAVPVAAVLKIALCEWHAQQEAKLHPAVASTAPDEAAISKIPVDFTVENSASSTRLRNKSQV